MTKLPNDILDIVYNVYINPKYIFVKLVLPEMMSLFRFIPEFLVPKPISYKFAKFSGYDYHDQIHLATITKFICFVSCFNRKNITCHIKINSTKT